MKKRKLDTKYLKWMFSKRKIQMQNKVKKPKLSTANIKKALLKSKADGVLKKITDLIKGNEYVSNFLAHLGSGGDPLDYIIDNWDDDITTIMETIKA